MILNLSDLINTSLFRDIFWSWWFRLEDIRLQFHFCLVWFRLTLFRQKVCQIDLNSRWGSWSQIIWRSGIFRFLELHELRFNHFNLLPFTFFLDSLVFLLLRSQMLFKYILIMGVSPENSLIIHNVQCSSTFFFLGNWWVKHTILSSTILVFSLDYLWSSAFKTMC